MVLILLSPHYPSRESLHTYQSPQELWWFAWSCDANFPFSEVWNLSNHSFLVFATCFWSVLVGKGATGGTKWLTRDPRISLPVPLWRSPTSCSWWSVTLWVWWLLSCTSLGTRSTKCSSGSHFLWFSETHCSPWEEYAPCGNQDLQIYRGQSCKKVQMLPIKSHWECWNWSHSFCHCI